MVCYVTLSSVVYKSVFYKALYIFHTMYYTVVIIYTVFCIAEEVVIVYDFK